MHKMPALKALIQANQFAYKSHKGAYIGRVLTEVLSVVGLLLSMKSVEYTTNSAYHLFEGQATINEVIVGVSLFTLGSLIFYLVGIFRDLLDNKLMLHMSHDFEYALGHKLGKVKWEYYENHETAVEIYKVREKSLEQIKNFVGLMMKSVFFVLGGVVFLTLLAQINLMAVATYLVLLLFMNKAFEKVYKQVKDAWDELQPYKQKQNYFFSLSGDKVTHQEYQFNRLFGFVANRWEQLYHAEYKIQMKIFGKYEITFQTARFLINLPYIAMLIFVGYEIAIGKHEIGFLMLCNQLFNYVLDLVIDVQYSVNDARTQYGFVESFFNLLELDEMKESSHMSNYEFKSIQFNQLAYAYPQAKYQSLKGIDLNIKAGEKVAIVGHNGSGKTTFTNVLLGLTDRFSGTVNMKGINGEQISVGNLASCILQDFAQYQLTIRENIELGYTAKTFTDEEIWKCLEQVGLKEMVSKLPQGIDTMLGQLQEGMDLSKGQWQRIAIARLLANPEAKIWVLDEPTAYLDPISEIEIYDLIYELAGQRIVLFISHRLGFAKRTDRIIVFDDGKVAEEGNHTQLLEKDGIYAEMYKMQETWYVA